MRIVLISILMLFSTISHASSILEKTLDIGTAYVTHLFVHEMGHVVVADAYGAKKVQVRIRTDDFPFVLTSYKGLEKKSVLPFAAAGEFSGVFLFEAALKAYRDKPNTYNKSLLFFGTINPILYSLMPRTEFSDYSIIAEETNTNIEIITGAVILKSMINLYRVHNKDFNVVPYVELQDDSAALMFLWRF